MLSPSQTEIPTLHLVVDFSWTLRHFQVADHQSFASTFGSLGPSASLKDPHLPLWIWSGFDDGAYVKSQTWSGNENENEDRTHGQKVEYDLSESNGHGQNDVRFLSLMKTWIKSEGRMERRGELEQEI